MPEPDRLVDGEGISFRSGDWRTAIREIRGCVERCETIGEVASLLEALGTDDLMAQQRGRMRLEQLERLTWAVIEDSDDSPDREAARTDARAEVVLGVCRGVVALCFAIADSGAVEARLARPLLATARTLVIEDLESIFDFELMVEGATFLVQILLERALTENRFDDLRIATRVFQIVADARHEDVAPSNLAAPALLQCLLEMPVFNQREIPERLAIIEMLHDWLTPLKEAGRLPDPVPELLERAARADRDSFSATEDYGPYLETVTRLEGAYEVTGNSAYLNDLILYCEPDRDGESDEEAAHRLDQLALFLRRRALGRGNASDVWRAREYQLRALRLTGPDHPSWRHYSNGVAASEYALAIASGSSVADQIERLRAHLPQLPLGSDEGDPSVAAEACALSLMMELTAAAQHEDEAEKPALLQRSIVAATEAQRLFEAAGDTDDAYEMSLLAEATKGLDAAVREGIYDERGTRALAESIEPTRRHTRFLPTTLAITRWMLAAAPDSRDPLIEALGKRDSDRPIGKTSKQLFDFEVLRWLAVGILLRGDIASADGFARAVFRERLQELIGRALSCGAADVAREGADAPLAASTQIVGEAAVQLALAGECGEAAHLAQISVAVRANNALLSRVRREGIDVEQLAPSQGESAASLIAIVGWETTVVLLRLPGDEWTLVASHPSEGLADLDRRDWVGAEHTAAGLLSLKHWLDRLEPVLCETLASSVLRAQAAVDTPVLCLGTGCLSHYPLGLLAARRPEIALPLPITTGLLVDQAALMLRDPVEAKRCAFFAGASSVAGVGSVDIESDLDAIHAAGLDVEVLGAGKSRGEASVWPPPGAADVLHYAGHLEPAGPDLTEIVLADGSRLETSAIRRTDLRALRVAVLMCCHSSSPRRAFSGEQIQHLAGAFLEAGTAAVVASIWPAFDFPSRLFNLRFYELLASGADLSSCFSAAVQAIRTHRVEKMFPFAHPVFWAGFALYVGVGSWLPARAAVDH
ncbi:MAG TPA: CHAT domain-containing protein [Solirubrobacterales bacterium]|jgi:hypothetical protein|nr:CHAT domain-containing protein [Solirubrobacterales bacterium]